MDTALLYLIGASVVIMFASLAGVLLITRKLEDWTQANLKYLIAFAAGVFLIVSYDLIFEAFEFATSTTIVVISIIAGFLLFYIVERVYPESHCHHDDATCIAEKNKRGAKKILVGDALHNAGDGILLAPIFMIDIRLGFVAAFGIFVHEFVQEISEYFVLRKAGYTAKQALVRNFLISATVLIGAIGGYYLTSFKELVGPLVGLAAGAFIYILLVDLIPESVQHSKEEQRYINYIVWGLLGVLLIISVNAISSHQLEKQGLDGHGHLYSEEEHHQGEHNHHEREEERHGHEEEEHYHDDDHHDKSHPELM